MPDPETVQWVSSGRSNAWLPRAGDASLISPPERGAYLTAPIGDSLVVMRPAGRRLFVINAPAAVALEACRGAAEGGEAEAVAAALGDTFGLSAEVATAEALALVSGWRAAGLVGGKDGEEMAADWVIAPPSPVERLSHHAVIALAGVSCALDVADEGLRAVLLRHIGASPEAPGATTQHVLCFSGTAEGWSLSLNGAHHASGSDGDAAVATALGLVADLAAQAEDRLVVVHGAGLARADGLTALLIAPSGHGKTTLAAALNAEGLALLSDDVVPVRRDGTPLALGLPICVKSGSWPVLRARRADLDAAEPIRRHGERVRFLPPLRWTTGAPLRLGILLFPAYVPGQPAHSERLSPEGALQLIVESDSIIRNVTEDKLRDLARWVGSVPAIALRYPDLDSGTAAVHRLLGDG